jgi:hypothetical protein
MNISMARCAVVGMGAFVLLCTLVGCSAQAEPAPGEDEHENVTQTEEAITATRPSGGTSGGTVRTCLRYCSANYCTTIPEPCPPGELCFLKDCSTVTICCQYAQ